MYLFHLYLHNRKEIHNKIGTEKHEEVGQEYMKFIL